MPEKLLLSQKQEKYLEWLLTPEINREPQTKKAFAESIDVFPSALFAWEKKKTFIERWKMGIEGMNQSPERTQRLLDAIYDKGMSGDTKSAELYLKATGNMPNSSTLNIKTESVVRDISDDDLEKMIVELGTKHRIDRIDFPITIMPLV